MDSRFRHIFLPCFGVCVAMTGCQSLFQSHGQTQALRESVTYAIARELEAIPHSGDGNSGRAERIRIVQTESEVLSELESRREELDSMGPLAVGSDPELELGIDLTGAEQQQVSLGLVDAVRSAIARNLGIEVTRFQPQIRAEDLIAAEAVFDAVLFANVDFTKTDQPQRVPVIMGVLLGTPFSSSERYKFETGLRKTLSTGAEVTVSTDIERFRNVSPGISFFPDPAYTAAVRLGVTQPLLRGFGDSVSRSAIRLSRNEEKRSIEQLRSELLQLVAETESAYWDLVFTWRDLAIAEWLVEAAVRVREVLERRRDFDTTLAQYSDAVARVEQRRADVIRARRSVRRASDTLKVFINDPNMSVSSEAVLFPLDETIESPITYNLREVILTGIDNRPEVGQAVVSISDAEIRETVADVNRLPLLDLSANVAYFGLDQTAESSYSELGESRFIDYVLGLTFEIPLGNRAAEAEYRKTRLERSSAITSYRQTVQQIIAEVKSALRDVIANYELIQATRSFRVAQAENLRTLLVEEETLAALTPEFLNLKFTRQDTLATARRQEVQAVINFDKSLAELYRAMGIGLSMKKIDVEIDDASDR